MDEKDILNGLNEPYKTENTESLKENETNREINEQSETGEQIEETKSFLEDETERLKDTKTGVKIKYILSEEEITEIFKHTEGYRKNKLLQKRHTIIQGFLFVILVLVWIVLKNNYYGFIMLMPLICIGIIWGMPILSMKRLAKEFFSGEEMEAEIYPNKICLQVRDKEREIPLNSSVKYEELAGMIMIYPAEGDTVMIPMRAIKPEVLPDVQAMIFSGATPKHEE